MNKIIHGDVLKKLAGLSPDSVHLIVTSPPYNLSIDYDNHTDDLSESTYLEWMANVWAECNRVLCDGGRLCINIGENKRQNIASPTFSAFIQQCVELKMLYRGTLIWNKNSAAKHCAWGSWKSPSNPHIVPRHEYIIAFSKGQYKLPGNGDASDITKEEFMLYTRSVWSFGTESKKKIGHPAPFPVELPLRLIKFYTYPGQTVLDPFGGSGTVGVACKILHRQYILIDNCKEYCDLAKQRIADAKKPLLYSTSSDYSADKGDYSSEANNMLEQSACSIKSAVNIGRHG